MSIASTELLIHPPCLSVDRPPQRRLLLVSYHFPPGQATGALRWQKLVGQAADRGWLFDVVTLHPDSLAAPDHIRSGELPAGTRVHGVHAPTRRTGPGLAGAIRKLLTKARRHPPAYAAAAGPPAAPTHQIVMRESIAWDLGSPRGWIRALHAWQYFREEGQWAKRAERVAMERAARTRYAAVVTCGPPHMVHCAGRTVTRATGIPWVMDLRDPWSLSPGLYESEASPLWYRIAEHLERRCVDAAALVVTNTEPHRLALAQRYPAARNRTLSILNGCDEDLRPRSRRTRRFTIAYAGNIYIDRDPRPLFRAVAELVREERLEPTDVGIEFIGNADEYAGMSVLAIAESEGIGRYVSVHPRRPRREALEFLEGAAMMLSLPQGVDLAIPSKIFEYMQFEAWVLALAKPGSATEVLLRGSSADVVDPDDYAGIARVLRKRYRAYRAADPPSRVNADGRFDRRHQAERLFTAIEALFPEAASIPGVAR